jgi:Skp family chaperone for outer membrane proteins
MRKLFWITFLAAIATAVLTSCNNQKIGFYNGTEIGQHVLAPITATIQAEKTQLEHKRDSLSKVPGNENEVIFINSQLSDWSNLSVRKFTEAVEPLQDSLNKKIDAAIKKVATAKDVTLLDASVVPVVNVKNDFTNDIKKELK